MGEDDERHLTGSGGDAKSAGTSVSGVGGEAMTMADEESGLEPVDEGGARIGWGRDAAEAPEQPVAGNDATGQSERPAEPEA